MLSRGVTWFESKEFQSLSLIWQYRDIIRDSREGTRVERTGRTFRFAKFYFTLCPVKRSILLKTIQDPLRVRVSLREFTRFMAVLLSEVNEATWDPSVRDRHAGFVGYFLIISWKIESGFYSVFELLDYSECIPSDRWNITRNVRTN